MSRREPPPELDAEREVDLARAAQAVAARWWLLLIGLVAGVVVGWFAAVGGTDVYRASALIYTGYPLAVGGGSAAERERDAGDGAPDRAVRGGRPARRPRERPASRRAALGDLAVRSERRHAGRRRRRR